MARGPIPFVVFKTVPSVSGSQGSETVNIAVSGASVLINIRGGGPATLYTGETGSTTIANPTTTTAEGRIVGWLDEGSYNMTVSGSGIATYSQDFEIGRGDGVGRYAPVSIPTAALIDGAVTTAKIPDGAITTAKIANANVTTAKIPDGAITTPKIANNAVTDALLAVSASLPVGAVIDWWRAPGSTATVPTGFAVCDGSTLTSGNHSFAGVAGSVTLPDLRNKFILGADISKSDGTAGTSDGSAAPGIRGVGGSHTIALSQANMPAHHHGLSGTTSAENSSLSHNHGVSGTTGGENSSLNHSHGLNYAQISASSGSGGASVSASPGQPKGDIETIVSGPSGHSHNFSVASASGGPSNHTHNFSATTDDGPGAGTAHENRPSYYGLLKIMKVKIA